jgi:hypothetical protein
MLLLLLLQHGKNLNVDAWRLHQLAKATANQEHAWSRFFTGVRPLSTTGSGWVGLGLGDPHSVALSKLMCACVHLSAHKIVWCVLQCAVVC